MKTSGQVEEGTMSPMENVSLFLISNSPTEDTGIG